MLKRIHISTLILMIFGVNVSAQVKMASSAAASHASAVLEVESTSKGFLPPRLTTIQRSSITNPVAGMVVYNTTLACLEYYDGNLWSCAGASGTITTGEKGSTFTAPHGVAVSGFSTNTYCNNNLISAGYTSGTCAGSISVGTNTYDLLHMNGQCWLQTNLKEFPGFFGSYPTTSWLNTPVSDKGYWGYFNTVTGNGSAGWATSEPAAGEGLLYQWSAAMNNSIAERAQGACPAGYHVPSDCEWMFLEHGLGMLVGHQITTGWRNSGNVGTALKGSSAGDFKALLSGLRNSTNGTMTSRGTFGQWWTSNRSTSDLATIVTRRLDNSQVGVNRSFFPRSDAFSLRCLKD